MSMKKLFSLFAALLVVLAVNATTRTIYCHMEHGWWTTASAAVGAYAWYNDGSADIPNADWPGVRMTRVSEDNTNPHYNTWMIELDTQYTSIIFTRMNPSNEGTQYWLAKTTDLTIPAKRNLFTIDAAEKWDDDEHEHQTATGSWSLKDCKFYITGDAAALGAWDPEAVPSYGDTATLNLAAGAYKMKVTVDGTWETAKGITNLTERAAGLQDINGNIGFILPAAGEVKVIYTNSLFKLIGAFENTPIIKTYFATGGSWTGDDESSAVYDAATEKITVNIVPVKSDRWQGQVFYQTTPTQAGKFYDVSMKFKATNNIGGVLVKYQESPIMFTVDTITLVANTEYAFSLTNIIGQANGDGKLVFDFGWAPANTTITISDISIVERDPVLANGYYILGYNDNWDLAGVQADEKFTVNPSVDGEYMLNVTLEQGKEFQVIKVDMDTIGGWYPGGVGNNYVVDAEHAGAMTVYFRPAGGQDGWWKGYIYVAPRTPEAVAKNFEIDMQTDVMGGNSKYLYIDDEGHYNYSDDMPLEYNAQFVAQGFSGSHGYHQLVATVPVVAGDYKVTLGKCTYAYSADYTMAYVKNEAQTETFASCKQNTTEAEGGVCYHQNPATNVAEMEFTVAADQMVKILCAHYTPYIKFERILPPTGIVNTEVGEKAVKFFRDGQLFIEKGGKIYNVLGVEIR